MRNSITYSNGQALFGGLAAITAPAQNQLMKQPRQSNLNDDNDDNNTDNDENTMICKRVVTRDGRYITQITCYEKGQDGEQRQSLKLPLFGNNAGQGGGALASLFGINRQLDLGGRCTRNS